MNPINEFNISEEEDLINQIELEMRKIHLSVEKLYNNISLSESNDPVEKCLVGNYCFSACLLEKGLNDNSDRNEDAIKTLEDSLQKELDFLTSDLGQVLSKMNEYNQLISSMDKNIANLNAMKEVAKTEKNSMKNMDVVTRNLKMRFRKEKAELKTMISSLFGENYDIQNIIASVVDHHFAEGADKYLQLEDVDNITEQIELLRRTNLFDINPRDPLQIRLADLI